MANWFQRIFGQTAPPPAPDSSPPAPDVVALQSELQQLRLELQERDQQLRQAREELNRQRAGEAARVQEGVQAAQEKLLNLVAAPVVQLLTQAHLLEVENKPVQARDLVAVARRLVRALEDHGLRLLGSVGGMANYDPNCHAPLSNDTRIVAGQPVVIRFVGVATPDGKVLRKAGVEEARG
jgi:molecular chaperone GrpE (heat shock protein)